MYQATTPNHTYKLPIATSSCKTIQVSYKQGDKQLIWQSDGADLPDGMTFDGNKVIIRLTQEQTLGFNTKAPVTSQVRALTDDDDAFISRKFRISVKEAQNKEILK